MCGPTSRSTHSISGLWVLVLALWQWILGAGLGLGRGYERKLSCANLSGRCPVSGMVPVSPRTQAAMECNLRSSSSPKQLLTVDIPRWEEGVGRVTSPSADSTYLALDPPDSCMHFCPGCMGPPVSGEAGVHSGKRVTEVGTPLSLRHFLLTNPFGRPTFL